MRKKVFAFAFTLSLITFITACSKTIETNMEREVPDFEFTNQDGETVSLTDLEGNWWVADLIFTNCEDICIPMTSNMVNLQKDLQEKELDVQLISFTVDPDHDTPEVLREYAEEYDADLSNWSFLTGYDFETIQDMAYETFMQMVENDPDSDQVAHGAQFYLINPEGEAIKFYSGLNPEELDELIEDLETVL